MLPFTHNAASGKTLSVTATTGSVALASDTGNQVILTNIGADECYVELGDSTVTAVKNTGLCVLAYSQIVITRSATAHTHVAAVCDTGKTCTLKASTGHGE